MRAMSFFYMLSLMKSLLVGDASCFVSSFCGGLRVPPQVLSKAKKRVSSGRADAGAGAVVVSCGQDRAGQSDVVVNSAEVVVAVVAHGIREQHDCVDTALGFLALCVLLTGEVEHGGIIPSGAGVVSCDKIASGRVMVYSGHGRTNPAAQLC